MSRLITLLFGLALLGLPACGTLQRPDGPVRITDGLLLPVQDPRIRSSDFVRMTAITEEVRGRFASRGISILALSGGGANGAFGAGMLVGWSERGDRPAFDIVTGVSTGALAAPFAFAGSDWDPQLERAYTDGSASELLSWRNFAAFLYPSLFSNHVLRDLVDENVTPDLLEAVAREHAAGRRLLVATTDLDSQETVIWDMGQLATQGDANSLALFNQVLVASASIPGVFPPVLIAGRHSDDSVVLEMHVDGGVNVPFLAIPESHLLATGEQNADGNALYVLVNGKTGRDEAITAGRLSSILLRTYESMSKASLRTYLTATTAFAQRNGMFLYLSAIPENVEASGMRFDQQIMTAMFELGRARARSGEAWTRLDNEPQNSDASMEIPLDEIPELLRPEDAPPATPVP